MPTPLELAVPQISDPTVLRFARSVQEVISEPLRHTTAIPAAEAANARRFTIQARNRREETVLGSYPVLVWVAAAEWGAPSDTGNTVALVTGSTLMTITPHAMYVFLSDSAGLIVMDLTIAGAATRYVNAAPIAIPPITDPTTWAA